MINLLGYNYYPICDLIVDEIIELGIDSEEVIKIIPKFKLKNETKDYSKILSLFNNADTFIKIPSLNNKILEVQIIKRIISIIFISHCLSMNSTHDTEVTPLFYLNNISINYFTTKIGKEKIKEEFFDYHIPNYHSSNYPEFFNSPVFFNKPLYLTDNINDIIGGAKYPTKYYFFEICNFLEQNTELSKKLEIALSLMYNLIYQQIDINYFLLSCQILEVLLLKSSEEAKKSKISNRAAALILDGFQVTDKITLANKIAKLYKDRSDIVHEGKNYIDFYYENSEHLVFDICFSKNLFIKVIEKIITRKLNNIDELKNFTKSCLANDSVERYY